MRAEHGAQLVSVMVPVEQRKEANYSRLHRNRFRAN